MGSDPIPDLDPNPSLDLQSLCAVAKETTIGSFTHGGSGQMG